MDSLTLLQNLVGQKILDIDALAILYDDGSAKGFLSLDHDAVLLAFSAPDGGYALRFSVSPDFGLVIEVAEELRVPDNNDIISTHVLSLGLLLFGEYHHFTIVRVRAFYCPGERIEILWVAFSLHDGTELVIFADPMQVIQVSVQYDQAGWLEWFSRRKPLAVATFDSSTPAA